MTEKEDFSEYDAVVTMRHIREAKFCSRGTRAFFQQHGLDWNKFLKEGIPSKELIETGDVMALQVVRVANGRK